MVKIIVKGNNVEQAIRALKRKVQKAGIIKELREFRVSMPFVSDIYIITTSNS